MITPLRTLVALALILHAVGLFAIPHMPFLFSPDARELMKYGGHGALVNPEHPVIFALYLLPYPAFVAMLMGRLWGRYLLLAYVIIVALGTYFMGVSVGAFPDSLINLIALLLDGAILGLAFFSTDGSGRAA